MRIVREQMADLALACGVDVVRGEVYRLPSPRDARGREQRGARYAVVVQADEFLGLSTTLVAPTSASSLPASFRPTIALGGRETRVLVEQTTVVDPQRLGRSAGRLDAGELGGRRAPRPSRPLSRICPLHGLLWYRAGRARLSPFVVEEREDVPGEQLGREDVGEVLLALDDAEARVGSASATVSGSSLTASGLSEPVSTRTGTRIFAACAGSKVWSKNARISRVIVCAAATRAGQVGCADRIDLVLGNVHDLAHERLDRRLSIPRGHEQSSRRSTSSG